jgi:hypothetical protein
VWIVSVGCFCARKVGVVVENIVEINVVVDAIHKLEKYYMCFVIRNMILVSRHGIERWFL